jgi:hypothetical protein
VRVSRVLAGVGVAVALTVCPGAGDAQGQERPREPRQLSLLIGAGNYKYAPEWKELKNLLGPRTDVVRMQHALRRWGFAEGRDNQRVLVDAQASKAGIAAAFRWLAERATDSADVVVIYYSGHGSWAPDSAIDAVRTRDEEDGFDEGLVPWDARDAHNPRHLVLDDEIGRMLAQLGTRNVTMIVDACFSGTVTRGSPDDSSASAPVPRGPRPPAYATMGTSGGLLTGEAGMTHTLLTAASSSELAYERMIYPGEVMSGVFTRFLAEALDGADPNTRLDDLLRQVRTKVGQNQTPQLEGDRGARIFRVGAGVVVPERGYAVAVNAGPGRVGLDAGALHGVRKGALYDIYGPDETAFRAGRLAQVRVDSIFEASSFATVIPAVGMRPLPERMRATLSRVPPGAMALDRLRVYVHPSARAVRDSLASVAWLELTDRPVGGMAELRRRGEALQVLVGGYEVPPLRGDVAAGRAASVGADGVRGFTVEAASLCTPLRRAYAIAAMGLVRNDQPPPPARLRLDVRVLPIGVVPTTPSNTAVDTVHTDELYNIWAWITVPDEAVRSSSLYLTAGIAGYSAAPRVVWPEGTRVQTLLKPEQINAPLLIQPNFRASAIPGIETIKAVVGSDPYDLRALVNELPRCPVGPEERTRGGPGDDHVVTGWTAIERRLELHPRARP